MARTRGKKVTLAVTASASTTGRIDLEAGDGGRVYIPSGSAITSLAWYDSPSGASDDTYVMRDESQVAKSHAVEAGSSYPIPYTGNSAAFIFPVGNTTGNIYVVTKEAAKVSAQAVDESY